MQGSWFGTDFSRIRANETVKFRTVQNTILNPQDRWKDRLVPGHKMILTEFMKKSHFLMKVSSEIQENSIMYLFLPHR